MVRKYKITGPLPIAGKQPGEIVSSDMLTDEAHLVSIGVLSLVESGTASSTMKASKSSTQEKS